jgi:hypothetical protein
MSHRIIKILSCSVIAIIFVVASTRLTAQSGNGWKPLAAQYSVKALQQIILPENEWKPFPDLNDTTGFSKIPYTVRQAYIKAGEKLLHADWPALPASVFLEYVRNGNRSDYEELSFGRREQLATLVLAEAFERKGRFTDQIVNGVWAICEESFWGVPAHLNLQKAGHGLPDVQDPVVDLFAAETAQEIAWTYYLLKPELDKVNPLIAKRMEYEVKKRILLPYLRHDDWAYLGFIWKKDPGKNRRVNNWNPWINSNVLVAALVLAKDPELRLQVIHKTMESIDNFVIPYPADGGSDEGPEYWDRAAGALLDYLETLRSASAGRINAFGQPVIKNMGSYCYKMYIRDPYFVNYGDADARYHPDPALLFRFGKETHDTVLIRFAAFEAQKQHFGQDVLQYSFGVLNRALAGLFILKDLQNVPPEEPLVRDVWLPDIQVMAARSETGSANGFYIAVKGGDNGASHNHNDVGNYIVYFNGRPVLIDAGAQTYTAQTFSSRRYELWNNQSAYHNVPDINGTMQHEGSTYTATDLQYHANTKEASLQMNIAHAYPGAAHVSSWIRTVALNRGRDVEIKENYTLQSYKQPLVENFLTPLHVKMNKPGMVTLTDPVLHTDITIHFDKNKFRPALDTITINDGQPVVKNNQLQGRTGRMYRIWGKNLYRVRLVSTTQLSKDHFTIRISH